MRKLLLLMILGVCFLLSSESAEVSHMRSRTFLEMTVGRIYPIPKDDLAQWDHSIRKMAHFTLYFLVGSATIYFLDATRFSVSSKIFFFFCLLIFFSSLDEVHQLYSAGRTFLLGDILLDVGGGFLAFVFWTFGKRWYRKKG